MKSKHWGILLAVLFLTVFFMVGPSYLIGQSGEEEDEDIYESEDQKKEIHQSRTLESHSKL